MVSGFKHFLPIVRLHFSRRSIALLTIVMLSSGCALLKVKEQVRKSLESSVIVGHINAPPGKGPIVVAAYSRDKGKTSIAHYVALHDAGEYELMVSQGQYHIFAYRDGNSNLIYEDGEPAGIFGTPSLVAAPGGGVISEIDIHISKEDKNKAIPGGLPLGFELSPPGEPKHLHSRVAGAITPLNDPLFSDENGSKGYWEGLTFYKEIGGSIYFLEPYDPKKIPILFIHGATGTPRGWKYFVDHIDRTKFQPWFFYYPSGARIKSTSHLLLWKLYNLQNRYHFERLYITAHSMGGLLARSFIMDYGKNFPQIELFISLATPWGGDPMAEYGVKQSPGVIPCWNDIQPNSPFIQSLYESKLPETLDFYMFYGHVGNRNPLRSNNDGTITLASLLDRRPQREAKMNYGFNEDHTSIIQSAEVLEQYNTIINSSYERSNTSLQSGGFLRIALSKDSLEETESAILVLQPENAAHPQTITSFYHDENVSTLGPFPSGKYTANVLLPNAKTKRTNIPISIKSDTTSPLNFHLTPDGTISGYVTSEVKPKDFSVGMPITEYRPAVKKIVFQSVSLEGNGIQRIITPVETGEKFNFYTNLISRTDFCHDAFFHFFGLPEGEYEITINALGFKPKLVKHLVTPGGARDLLTTQLLPNK